jgi:hypothetical protein
MMTRARMLAPVELHRKCARTDKYDYDSLTRLLERIPEKLKELKWEAT